MSGNEEQRRASLLKRVLEVFKKDIDTSLPPEQREKKAQEKLTDMFREGWKAEVNLPDVTVVEVEKSQGPSSPEEIESFWRSIQSFSQEKGIEDTEHLEQNHGKSTEPDVVEARGGGDKKGQIKCLMHKILGLMDDK